MPRDNNGNYTLPAGNPVVAGTAITTLWANPTMQDLANEITNSLSRNGEGGMLVPFRNVDGTVFAPGVTWTNETVSGLYRFGANDMRVSVGAVDRFRWTSSSVQVWNIVDLIWEDVATGGDLSSYLPLVGGTVSGQIKGVTPLAPEDLTRKDYVDAIEPGLQSFNTREVPDVVPQLGDYDAVIVGYDSGLTPIWNATEVQAALEEAYADIQFLAGGIILKGIWDSFANVPDLLTIPKVNGNYWIVTVEGSTVLPAYPGAVFQLPYLVNDRVLYLDDGVDTGFAQIRQTAGGGDFLPLTGGTMLGQIKGVSPAPVAAADLTRKDYVDAQIAAIPPPDLTDYLPLVGGTVSGQIKGITPLDDADLTRKDYVLEQIANAPAGLVSFKGRTASDVVPIYDDYQAELVRFDNAFAVNWGTNTQTALDDAYGDIQFLAGAVVLKGVWDALANVPDLITTPKVSGNYWIVSVEGSTVLPLFPGAPAFVLPYEINDRILYLEDGLDTGFAQLRAAASDFLLLTGGTMSGQIKGIAPIDAPDLTRKDYVDGNFLPLTGGTLTGATFVKVDGNALTLRQVTNGIGNSLAFEDETNAQIGKLGGNGLGGFVLEATVGAYITAPLLTITAPTTNVNGLVVVDVPAVENNQIRFNSDGVQKAYLGVITANPNDFILRSYLGDVTLQSDTAINLNAPVIKASNKIEINTSLASPAAVDFFKDGVQKGFVGISSGGLDLTLQNLTNKVQIVSPNTINLNAPTVNLNKGSYLKFNESGVGTSWAFYQDIATDELRLARFDGAGIGLFALQVAGSGLVSFTSDVSCGGDVIAFAGLPNEVSMSDLVPSKAGTVASAGIGNYNVVFGTPFPDANYAITLSDGTNLGIGFDPNTTYSGKTATGFTVSTNTSTVPLNIDWIATPYNS